MKQVLPKFLSPTTPLLELAVSYRLVYYCSDYALLGHRPSCIVLSATLHFLEQYATNLQLQRCYNFYTDLQYAQLATGRLLLLKNIQLVFYYLYSRTISESDNIS